MYGRGSTSWRSPQSANAHQGPKSKALMKKCEETGQSEITLTDQAQHWTTPQTHDTTKGDAKRVDRYGTQHGGRNLNDEADKWATPKAQNSAGPGKHGEGGDDLQTQADDWATPKACNSDKPSAGKRKDSDLAQQAKSWGAPRANDAGTRRKKYQRGGSALSLQAEMMSLGGVAFLNAIRTSHPSYPWRLNSRFQHWLMHVPIGWIGCGLSATELILWSRRWRSRLFGTGYMGGD